MSYQSFRSFFEAATGFQDGPHDYQAQLAEGKSLPDILAVPTGCGKTAAAVVAWAWRRRKCPDDDIRQGTPRRLIYCLPMRSLVEQVHGDIVRWFANLNWLHCPESSDASYQPNWSRDKVPVFLLMGGEQASEWEAYPERQAVLVGTQDMLLSRALNRGYAMKPQAWPIAFGLVNIDALWILDEVQLMGSGRTTSVQLQNFQRAPHSLPRASVWMSATAGTANISDTGGLRTQQAPQWMQTPEHVERHSERDVAVLGLGHIDRKNMSKVLDASKYLQLLSDTIESESLSGELLKHAAGGRFVLVMVNRVERAQYLFRRVKELASRPDGPDILLLHSRFRPRERTRATDQVRKPTPKRGRIVISTQVLEAGVDLDADVLVTEICPWTSLIQRLGRLNRRGKREGVVEVLEVPVKPPSGGWPKKKADCQKAEMKAQGEAALPYTWCDLEIARKRADRLKNDASISAIERVDKADRLSVPVEGPVLRRHHLLDFFDTDVDLSGGHTDVSQYVRGDRRDLDVAVFWRAIGDDESSDAPPPHPDEICKVPIASLCELGYDTRGWLLGLQRSRRRDGAWREVRLSDPSIRPGDTLMLDISTGGYDDERGWVGSDQHKPSSWVSLVDGKRSWVRSDDSTVIDIDDRIAGWTSLEEDPRSYARHWMELSQHLSTAETKAHQLAKLLVPGLADKLATAARWHDIGKALERDNAEGAFSPFQDMLCKRGQVTPPDPNSLYAKSNHRDGRMRRGHSFRHEVASALAYLKEKDADDLVAWLIMAHHGKARMTLTPWNEERLDDVAGVRPGDRIPPSGMSSVSRDNARELDTELLLPAITHPGWQGRAVKLLEKYRPQFLAYLEALVRVADWRAG